MNALSVQPFVGDVGEPGVEQREIGAGIDRKMHDAILAGFDLAGIDRHRAARIDDDDAALLDRLRAELGLLLVAPRCRAGSGPSD